MRIGFDKANFGALADLWNATWPSRYSIDAELLQANTVDSPTFDWGA